MLSAQGSGHHSNGAVDEEGEEVVAEAILREASREVLTLIVALLQYPIDPVTAKLPKSPRGGDPSPIPIAQQVMAKPGAHRSLLQTAVETPKQLPIADAALALAVQGLRWPDFDIVRKSCQTCRFFISAATTPGVAHAAAWGAAVRGDMFNAAVHAFLHPSQGMHAEILGVLRAIVVGFWDQRWEVATGLMAVCHVR